MLQNFWLDLFYWVCDSCCHSLLYVQCNLFGHLDFQVFLVMLIFILEILSIRMPSFNSKKLGVSYAERRSVLLHVRSLSHSSDLYWSFVTCSDVPTWKQDGPYKAFNSVLSLISRCWNLVFCMYIKIISMVMKEEVMSVAKHDGTGTRSPVKLIITNNKIIFNKV